MFDPLTISHLKSNPALMRPYCQMCKWHGSWWTWEGDCRGEFEDHQKGSGIPRCRWLVAAEKAGHRSNISTKL